MNFSTNSTLDKGYTLHDFPTISEFKNGKF